MKRTELIQQRIETLHSPNRPRSLIETVGYLLLAGMRIDPGNPAWARGDKLFYATCFTGVVKDAYLAAGCPEEAVPAPGFALLETTVSQLTAEQSLFCLMESCGDARFKNSIQPSITVFCPEPPVDRSNWDIHSFDELDAGSLHALLSGTGELPRWITAPITGSMLLKPSKEPSNLPPLSARMSRLGTETAFSVLAEVNRLKDEGRDIISFGLGEPDFDTPGHVKEAAKNAIDRNETHYGPSAGIPELRQAAARYIQHTRHIPVDADEVVITPGAKPIIFDVMMSLLDPGDEVLYPNPGYPIYESVIEWIGAVSVPLPLREEQNWNFLVDDLIHRLTPKTRMIVLNTPGNPTGTMIGESELREIARLAIERNLWVISDEVYSQIVFDGEFHSIVSLPGMKERTILVDGFSKTYAMTGWRLGYGVMNKTLAEQTAKIETNIDSCTCSFTQIAGVHALEGPHDEPRYMAEQFKDRSRVIVEGLNDIEGVRCLPAGGAFYVFPNVTGACRRLGLSTANELQRALLEQAGVAVLPRTCFGRKNEGEDQEYIRLSFATSMENIREGLRRMKQFIER